jgi:CHAT domain-containing protein
MPAARALLVSHWPVVTTAATRLTTSTFEILKRDPRLGRAEALRRAMLAFLSDPSVPRNAYPAFWARSRSSATAPRGDTGRLPQVHHDGALHTNCYGYNSKELSLLPAASAR